MEKFDKINVAVRALEVLLEKDVHHRLNNQTVVDGIHANLVPYSIVNELHRKSDSHIFSYTFNTVPARLSSPSNGFIHDVISNKEESLELFVLAIR